MVEREEGSLVDVVWKGADEVLSYGQLGVCHGPESGSDGHDVVVDGAKFLVLEIEGCGGAGASAETSVGGNFGGHERIGWGDRTCDACVRVVVRGVADGVVGPAEKLGERVKGLGVSTSEVPGRSGTRERRGGMERKGGRETVGCGRGFGWIGKGEVEGRGAECRRFCHCL